MQCHSTPDVAPASQIATYGDEHGFGWELGEIVGTQIVYVPAEDVFRESRNIFYIGMGIFIGLFTTGIVMLNILLRRMVSRPVEEISALADEIRQGKDTSDLHTINKIGHRGDELGRMAQVFSGMAEEVRSREKQLQSEVQQLRIEIDQERRAQEVKRIAETDYFRDLQDRAAVLRKRFNKDTD